MAGMSVSAASRIETSEPRARAVTVNVPFQGGELAPVTPDRVRALRRNLVEAMRDLRRAKHPEKLIQPREPELDGFQATIAAAACAHCQGFCCKNGGEQAYIDDRTMARVRAERPELDARAVIRLYAESVPATAYRGSCIFHGEKGCTLDRPLRAELCNSYYCTGLRDFLNRKRVPGAAVVVASRNGAGQTSGTLRSET